MANGTNKKMQVASVVCACVCACDVSADITADEMGNAWVTVHVAKAARTAHAMMSVCVDDNTELFAALSTAHDHNHVTIAELFDRVGCKQPTRAANELSMLLSTLCADTMRDAIAQGNTHLTTCVKRHAMRGAFAALVA